MAVVFNLGSGRASRCSTTTEHNGSSSALLAVQRVVVRERESSGVVWRDERTVGWCFIVGTRLTVVGVQEGVRARESTPLAVLGGVATTRRWPLGFRGRGDRGEVSGELGVVTVLCAQTVLDGMMSSLWASGDDASMSVGSRGGQGVAGHRGVGRGVMVVQERRRAHGHGEQLLGELDFEQQGQSGCMVVAQSAEEKWGRVLAQPRAVAWPSPPCSHVTEEERGERDGASRETPAGSRQTTVTRVLGATGV